MLLKSYAFKSSSSLRQNKVTKFNGAHFLVNGYWVVVSAEHHKPLVIQSAPLFFWIFILQEHHKLDHNISPQILKSMFRVNVYLSIFILQENYKLKQNIFPQILKSMFCINVYWSKFLSLGYGQWSGKKLSVIKIFHKAAILSIYCISHFGKHLLPCTWIFFTCLERFFQLHYCHWSSENNKTLKRQLEARPSANWHGCTSQWIKQNSDKSVEGWVGCTALKKAHTHTQIRAP